MLETEETVADFDPNRTDVELRFVPKPVPRIFTAVPAGPVETLSEVIAGVAAAEYLKLHVEAQAASSCNRPKSTVS